MRPKRFERLRDDPVDRLGGGESRHRWPGNAGPAASTAAAVCVGGVRPARRCRRPPAASATAMRLAEAGVGAGDQRDLAGEIERRLAHFSWQMSRTFMSV